MDARTEELPAFTVVGMARRQSNDRPDEIGKQWQDFFAAGGAAQIPNRLSDEIYAVYTEYEGDYTRPYTIVIGCQVAADGALPAGLVRKTVPGARYAVFDARGPQPASIVAAWQRVWAASLPRSYGSDFDRHRGPEDVEVFVSVE
jgi:predicted transcriptional regulator YdeE